MTISNSERELAVVRALCLMLDDLGNGAIDGCRFEIRSDRYACLPQTTWLELEGLGYARNAATFGSPAYRITGTGWIAALKAAGMLDKVELRDKAVRLRAALKAVVKGRDLRGGPHQP